MVISGAVVISSFAALTFTPMLATKLLKQQKKKNAFYYGYLCVTDCDKESVTLQEGETIAYKWLSEKEFLRFIDTNDYVMVHKDRIMIYFKK